MQQLIKTGQVSGFEAHHINSVAAHSVEMARDPNNIKFVEGRAAHLLEHAGNFHNTTTGKLIDRTLAAGLPVLSAIANRFDSDMKDAQQSWAGGLLSDPDSVKSWFNPVNHIVEDATLLGATGDTLFGVEKK